MHTYAFEKLQVWQDARVFCVYMYRVTMNFPNEERFGLTNQIRRAAVSIASNIAEGSARKSAKDQAHFYQMAYSSTLEVLNQLLICYDLKFITTDQYTDSRNKIEMITNKLNALRKTIVTAGY